MKSTHKLAFACSAAALALPSAALAQEDERYFDGLYISGALGMESAADGSSDGFVFDTDGDGDFTDTVRTTEGIASFSPGFCSGAATSPARNCRGNPSTEGYAVRVGYDRSLGDGPIVLGILVEGARPKAREITTGYTTGPEFYSISRDIDWAVTGRARIGIAPGEGRALFYGTGGAGFARIDHNFVTSNAINAFTQENDTNWEFGWQAGGGAELMLTRNIGLGLEYLYSSYNDDEYSVTAEQGIAVDTNPFVLTSSRTDFRLSNERFELHAFRATASLRF